MAEAENDVVRAKEKKEKDNNPIFSFDVSAFQAVRCLVTAGRGCRDGRQEKVAGWVYGSQLGAD